MKNDLRLFYFHQVRTWVVNSGVVPVAEIHLDYLCQVKELVFHLDVTVSDRLQILHLALSHVQQFVRRREVSDARDHSMMIPNNRDLKDEDSYLFMDFDHIPNHIRKLDYDAVTKELQLCKVLVLKVVHKRLSEAIDAAIARVGVEGLRHKVVQNQRSIFQNETGLSFSVTKPNRFTFWKSESKPSRGFFDLHIIPSYHPVMSNWKEVGMINGCTDAFIRGDVVRYMCCPKASRATRHERHFGSTWTHVRHPYHAFGRSVQMQVHTNRARTAEGVDELVEVLSGLLSLGKRYVSVSGGFRSPMKCAHNRLLEIGTSSPYPDASSRGATARGSEEHCVWAYRTLKAEGVLAEAHVPEWFIPEGWLEIYEGAEVSHGLY